MAGSQTLPNTDQLAEQKWALTLLEMIFFLVIDLLLSKFFEGL